MGDISEIFNKKIPFLDKVILKDSTNSEAGYRSHDDRSHLVGKLLKQSLTSDLLGLLIVTMKE